MDLKYFRGLQKVMPHKTTWCVEVKDDRGLIDQRIFSNRAKALEWCDKVKANEKVWTEDTRLNCFQLPMDWFEWPHE